MRARQGFLRPFGLGACLALALSGLPATVLGQGDEGAPLSAIDWLQQALEAPLPQSSVPEGVFLPDGNGVVVPQTHFESILSAPLEGLGLEAVGLFRAERVGLPRDLWGNSPRSEVIAALSAMPQDGLPSAMRLGLRVLLAEFLPPRDDMPQSRDALLLARLDKLVALGALEQAGQLIEGVAEASAGVNARAFEIALLLGEEDRACTQMRGQIAASYGHAAQIFCMARNGEWQAAYAGLQVARGLGLLSMAEAGILLRFLEEEESDLPPPPPQEITPLGWRIMEALGDPVTTAGLPIAYAHADLRGTSGWRAQLDAAERLTRAGVLQPNRLYGLYTERRAAASGGLWERVRAMQALERALASGDSAATGAALVQAWPIFAEVDLEVALAEILAPVMVDMPVTGQARDVLWKVLILAQEQSGRAADLAPDTVLARLVMALAAGEALPQVSAPPMAAAIVVGFGAVAVPAAVQDQIAQGARGLVLLDALGLLSQAAAGDVQAASEAMYRLRALGLEALARQVAIELLLVERRG
ncbi:MAG: hypothetical protein LAT78_11375 [Roseinatronobacter sp.]|nr:hypothetical protein [Roseinatronobacter sp.]